MLKNNQNDKRYKQLFPLLPLKRIFITPKLRKGPEYFTARKKTLEPWLHRHADFLNFHHFRTAYVI